MLEPAEAKGLIDLGIVLTPASQLEWEESKVADRKVGSGEIPRA